MCIYCLLYGLFCISEVECHSSVGYVQDLRTGVADSIPCSFKEKIIVIATGFIPLLPLFIVFTMIKWESSQWLGKNIVRSTG